MSSLMKMAEVARAKIRAAEAELLSIQEACSHPIETRDIENRAHDGYAEPTQYTARHRCDVCGKIWVVDQ